MPYPVGHSVAVRAEIIESARKLFNQHGFDGVSIDQIMSGAGLTRGGFYSHFQSKSDLYGEVLGCFFTDPNWKNRWEGVDFAEDPGPQVVRAYLSRLLCDAYSLVLAGTLCMFCNSGSTSSGPAGASPTGF